MTMRFTAPLAGALLLIAGAAQAVIVPGTFDTGRGPGNTALAAGDGQIDANYTVIATDDANVVVGSQARTYYNPAYLQDGPLSRIVNGTGDGSASTNTFTTFRTTFSLAGFDTATATLSGQVLFDNSGTIFLNGNQVGGTFTGFNSLSPFGTNASFFVAGLNTLDFRMFNVDGPAAFQVAGLTVTAEALPVGPGVPEPATWGLMIVGFTMVGAVARRRNRTSVTA